MAEKRSSNPGPVDYGAAAVEFQRMPILGRMVAMHRMNRETLGLPKCLDKDLEDATFLVYNSMEAPTRIFHNIDHVIDLHIGCDPIQVSAIAFHDVIYYKIDGGLSDDQRKYIGDVINERDDGVVAITEQKLDTSIEMVMDVFGYNYGQVLDPYKGMNEFLSACLAARVHSSLDNGRTPLLTKSLNAKRSACIEATIPFRGLDEKGRTPPEALFDRLETVNQTYDLGWDEEELVLAVQRAVDLGNRDLENFSWTDRAAFLSNTWKMLPEHNMKLRKTFYFISDIAQAMRNQSKFFQFLNPENVFLSFRDPETEAISKKKNVQAKRNIETSLIYMNCKYLSLSVLSAIAELTGGDAPISMFMGDRPISRHRMNALSLIDFLDMESEPAKDLKYDKDVMNLLRDGRKLESKFDTKKSLFSVFIYKHIGDDGVNECMKFAPHPMDKTNAMLLLQALPSKVALEILMASSKMTLTRKVEINLIMSKISQSYNDSLEK